jgi:hypothetical protein
LLICNTKGRCVFIFYDPNDESRDYDDDERFYEKSVYNEQYYLEREQELIRESNLEIEIKELDESNIQDTQAEDLLQLHFSQPGENNSRQAEPKPVNPSDDPGDLSF